ncbi:MULTISPECIES: fatty acid desaturase [unclassified Nocardioides]|uniref:fatty acid desaturase n=1 Tax=unclassified Nocardioides TaxID=2615069 RepID=UPI0009F14075|nr:MULTISPECIES: fatty acid desaturase [unclassified Nocardioides]GAW49823.1 Possible phthalate 4,5-dioxygenase [Nocardioides sp. PD653-B2]GAW57135.1 Possible phthalate 4,5-dioxygenase [Nocardioides sp. PD653]
MTAPTIARNPEATQPVLGLPDPGETVPRLAWPTVLLFVGTLGLFAFEAWAVLAAQWSPWRTVPIGAAVTFLMFSVLHEATHHAISTDTRLNNAFGHLAQPFVAAYATFPLMQFIHIEHHRNTNEPKASDPDAWTSEGPWWQLPFRWATIDVWYVAFYVRRLRERPRAEVVVTLGTFLSVAAVFGAVAATGHLYELVVLYLVPQRIGLTILAWWFDYLPHHGLTATQREDKYRATRVRVGGEAWLTPLFVYQNYHLVHHLHPSVPFYRYVRAWRRNETAYLDRDAAISTWFGRSLTAEEYRTWRRLTDRLSGPALSGRRAAFHPLRVTSVERMTEDSVVLSFAVPEDLAPDYRYTAGQHVTLRAVIDGQDVRRSYSLCAPATTGELRVAVKRVEGGVFSSYLNGELRSGDILDVMTPTGRFGIPLDAGAKHAYVGVAAGSGITPLVSIIATALEVEQASTFDLVYGNRAAASTMFRRELDALVTEFDGRLRVHHVVSREDAALTGRIDRALVARLVGDRVASVDAWLLCGPQAMVEDVTDGLLQAGVAEDRVHSELFHTAAEPVEAHDGDLASLVSRVSVALDGAETTFELAAAGATVLDAALAAGVDAPYACAGGACGTCRAKVMLGTAAMDQNHALDAAEVDEGYVLTCQAHPTSEELRVDYDA